MVQLRYPPLTEALEKLCDIEQCFGTVTSLGLRPREVTSPKHCSISHNFSRASVRGG